MDEDQWTYDNTMSEEVDMDYENEEECGVNEPHVVYEILTHPNSWLLLLSSSSWTSWDSRLPSKLVRVYELTLEFDNLAHECIKLACFT